MGHQPDTLCAEGSSPSTSTQFPWDWRCVTLETCRAGANHRKREPLHYEAALLSFVDAAALVAICATPSADPSPTALKVIERQLMMGKIRSDAMADPRSNSDTGGAGAETAGS